MQSIIRFLKNVWTVLFDINVMERSRALKELAPRLWNRVWCSGHTRSSEQKDYIHSRDITDMNAELMRLRQQASKRDSKGRFAPKNTGQ